MKHQAWRHDPAAYGAPQPAPTRFADVDTRRHVNNIAVHGLHQEARQRWLMAAGGAAVWPQGGLRLKPVHCRTEFWRECHYPAPVSAGLRWLGLAPQAVTLAAALFQGDDCVGMQQTEIGAWDTDLARRVDLPPPLLARLASTGGPCGDPGGDSGGDNGGNPRGAIQPLQRPAGSDQRVHYPVAAELSSRYGDFDADGGSSEAAVMRGIEQARAALLQQAFAAAGGDPASDWVKLLVARIDLHWAHHRAPPRAWALASAVSHTGRSSVRLRVAMFDGAVLQAMADCVMVYTDPTGQAGAQALPAPLRAALQALAWRGAA
jgi:acyl-CoA thioesterase FadM